MSDEHVARIESQLERLGNRLDHLEVDVRALTIGQVRVKGDVQLLNARLGYLKTNVEDLRTNVSES